MTNTLDFNDFLICYTPKKNPYLTPKIQYGFFLSPKSIDIKNQIEYNQGVKKK